MCLCSESEQLADTLCLAKGISFGQPLTRPFRMMFTVSILCRGPPRTLKASRAFGQPHSLVHRSVCGRIGGVLVHVHDPRSSRVAGNYPTARWLYGESVWLHRYR